MPAGHGNDDPGVGMACSDFSCPCFTHLHRLDGHTMSFAARVRKSLLLSNRIFRNPSNGNHCRLGPSYMIMKVQETLVFKMGNLQQPNLESLCRVLNNVCITKIDSNGLSKELGILSIPSTATEVAHNSQPFNLLSWRNDASTDRGQIQPSTNHGSLTFQGLGSVPRGYNRQDDKEHLCKISPLGKDIQIRMHIACLVWSSEYHAISVPKLLVIMPCHVIRKDPNMKLFEY